MSFADIVCAFYVRWRRGVLCLIIVPLLTSCYLPYGYLTKIQIATDGRYDLKFTGRLLAPSFMNKMASEEISTNGEDYEREKNAHITELQRQGFTNIQYVYPASYEVQLDRSGNLFKERLVPFPSRHGMILVMKVIKDNELVVQTRQLTEGYIKQLESSDIRFVGDVVIWTDIQVEQHNASIVQPGKPDAYLWQFKSLNDKPMQLIGKLGRSERN